MCLCCIRCGDCAFGISAIPWKFINFNLPTGRDFVCCCSFSQQAKVNGCITFVAIFAIAFSGLSVNPVQYSTRPLTDQPVVNQVRALQDEEPGVWITEGNDSARLANLLVANGVKTFNAVAVTPDLQKMKRIDPGERWKRIYNRYAFIEMNVVNKPAKHLLS